MDRIQLGNEEFEGRNNAYVLEDGERLGLVDTGIATDRTRRQLAEGLAERGHSFADVDQIAITHWHMDHAGLAGEIQAESGATVYVHVADAPLIAGDVDAHESMRERQAALFAQWGIPQSAREELLAFFESGDGIQGDGVEPTPIEDGDAIEVGGTTLETVHAPGHAAGLCCFELPDGTEAFSGDAVLPVYTPNVGGADVRVERPLERYLETLERIASKDYEVLWPGHRDPIEEPTERSRAIIEHHHERTARIVDVLEALGPADAWTVSAELFGDLAGIHIMHGPGEAYAHLDHLEAEGVVSMADGVYTLEEPGVDIEGIFA